MELDATFIQAQQIKSYSSRRSVDLYVYYILENRPHPMLLTMLIYILQSYSHIFFLAPSQNISNSKFCVRPYLEYGDFNYHIPSNVREFSQNIILPRVTEKFESVQYSAAFAVTGSWKGTFRDKLYGEFGWESLRSRGWSRRLTLFYKIINNLTPLLYKGSYPTNSSVAILPSYVE